MDTTDLFPAAAQARFAAECAPPTDAQLLAALKLAQAVAEADLDVSDEDMTDEAELDDERAYAAFQSEYDHNARR